MENSSIKKQATFNAGMVKDVSGLFLQPGMYNHAINAINKSHEGEMGVIGNEPSNRFCSSAPYEILGLAHIEKSRWVIFSGDGTNSEIGVFDESNCSYNKVVNDACLGFKRTHLINAVTKRNYDKTHSVYFVDSLNDDRVLNLDNVPYLKTGRNLSIDPTCYIPEYSDSLDCDAIKLHAIVKEPCLKLSRADGAGQLINGNYMAFVAYSENGIRLTSYSMPSNWQSLWSHTGIGGGLELNLTNLDDSYDEFELVIIAITNSQSIAKKIGYYSTRQTKVTLDLYNQSLETVDFASLILKPTIYNKSDKIFDVNDYLIRAGVQANAYFNYQPQANLIEVEWVAIEYDADYYYKGGNNIGYMRDETYPVSLRWVHDSQARSSDFHIPGREARVSDLVATSGPDSVYPEDTVRWRVYDTSTIISANEQLPDGGVIVERGEMAYTESTELYPDDNPEVWGDLCGKPIRHHKMPSNETTHIHSKNGEKIKVLGIRLKNVTHPLDENGVPIKGIIGYEVLRGSREGNKSIVAKGMFNNMMEYNIQGTTKKSLMQNYPYNQVSPDPFLTNDVSAYDGSGSTSVINSAAQLNEYKKDYLSFHSPDTSFFNPYIGENHIKIYKEIAGDVEGNFQYVHNQPRQKIITDTAFLGALLVGVGIALLSSVGRTTLTSTTGWEAPDITGGPILKTNASKDSGTASVLFDYGVYTGVSSAGAGWANTAAQIASIGYAALTFAHNVSVGTDQSLELLYAVIPGRYYMLQYNSHGFYNESSQVNNPDAPSGVAPSFRRKVVDGMSKYVGSGIQTFNSDYKINNLFRDKGLVVQLESEVPYPSSDVDNTKLRIRDTGASRKNPSAKRIDSRTVSYYGALKFDYDNQYGQLDSVLSLPTNSCIYETYQNPNGRYNTDVIFGGDIYINRFTEKNSYCFFNSWLIGAPSGTEIDYRDYVNGPIPRYWANFEKFDITDFDLKLKKSFPFVDPQTPSDDHRLDRPGAAASGLLSVRDSYFYQSSNGVRDFFVESEINVAFRDYGESEREKHYDVYGDSFSDLEVMFRSDLIKNSSYYKYDNSLSVSKAFTSKVSWGFLLPRDYTPSKYNEKFQYYENRVVYSLQQQEGLKRDNWRNFLPLNYKDFEGKVNSIKNIQGTGSVILFEDREPLYFAGVDKLETESGVKVVIGDGGLFANNQQALTNVDDSMEYANCISERSAIGTHSGLFYASQKNGKIMNFSVPSRQGGGLNAISDFGLKHWFMNNLPSNLLRVYPDYPLYDNPVSGIGVQSVYDPQYDLVYFSKKDYLPKRTDLKFDDPSGIPYYVCGSTNNPPPNIPACEKELDIAIIWDINLSMAGGTDGGVNSFDQQRIELKSLVDYIVAEADGDYRISLTTVNEIDAPLIGHVINIDNLIPFDELNNEIAVHAALDAVVVGDGIDQSANPWDIAIENVIDGDYGDFRFGSVKHIYLLTNSYPSGTNDAYSAADDTELDRISLKANEDDIKIDVMYSSQTYDTGLEYWDPLKEEAMKIATRNTGGQYMRGFHGVIRGQELGYFLADAWCDALEPTTLNCLPPRDIAIILDRSVSMDDAKADLIANIASIVSDIDASSDSDYRIALLTVGGAISTNPPIAQPFSKWENYVSLYVPFSTNNGAAVISALSSIVIGGGFEPSGEAIEKVLDGWAGELREDAEKLIVVITDDFPQEAQNLGTGYNALYETRQNEIILKANILDARISPIVVRDQYTGTWIRQPLLDLWQIFADQTGGTLYEKQDSEISDEIIDAVARQSSCLTDMECLLVSDSYNLSYGDTATLSWDTHYVGAGSLSVVLNPGNISVAASGTLDVTPLIDTKYTLILTNEDGVHELCSILIVVNEPAEVRCPCAYDDPNCFEPANWTVSYDPTIQKWISYHDWQPSLMMQTMFHFSTIKGNGIWAHNDRWDSYCNYYGVDYPWEVDIPLPTGDNVSTIRSIEYLLEVFNFSNDGKDKNHILDSNFDRMIMYNSEQISGLLRGNISSKDNPIADLDYPILSPNWIDVLFSKEENKYRWNQFFDITNDRGEFSGNDISMWNTNADGVHKKINPFYVDYLKNDLQQKKMRHYDNSVILRRNVSGEDKMILKLFSSKNLISFR